VLQPSKLKCVRAAKRGLEASLQECLQSKALMSSRLVKCALQAVYFLDTVVCCQTHYILSKGARALHLTADDMLVFSCTGMK
jgi:hypothetical protein